MSKIVINNVELELDLLDADAMETYQTALNETLAKIKEVETSAANPADGLHVAESMRLQCKLVEDFTDQVFGEGTAKKCFPRPNHLGDHLDAFTKICNQASLAVKQTKDIMGKYSGQRLANRAERRNQDRNRAKNRNMAANYGAQ